MRCTLIMLAGALSLAACASGGDDAAQDDTTASGAATSPSGDTGLTATAAIARMRDASGRDLGTLALSNTANGISVTGVLRGVPAGEHAIHLHTTGRCEPPFQSAGGHWNPTNRQHGRDNPQGPHFGDMPNFTAAGDSTSIQVTTPGGTLTGDNALLDDDGAAVVIHAQADDYRTDPAGNAGDRIACGVVERR